MNDNLLFNIPEQPIKKEKPKLTCRNCIHRYKHEYGKMFYCEMQSQKRTAYGNRKIKANDPACHMYQTEKI